MQDVLAETRRVLKLRGYSLKTVKSYLIYIRQYLEFTKTKKLNDKNDAIEKFLLHKINLGRSPQTINLALNSIKFLYREVVKSPISKNFKSSKKPKKLPVILSRREIEKILSQIENQKHRLIISLSYASGLRVSEVVNLKIQDLDLDGLIIHLKSAKGKKDKITIFPQKLKIKIQNLISNKVGSDYVFESNRGNNLATTSVQKIFKKAFQKSGIQKNATFHSLRHSFATHLLESGTDVRYV